jgi:hypothetical protein
MRSGRTPEPTRLVAGVKRGVKHLRNRTAHNAQNRRSETGHGGRFCISGTR